MADRGLPPPSRRRLVVGVALALLVQGLAVLMLRTEHTAPTARTGPAGVLVRLLPADREPPPPPVMRDPVQRQQPKSPAAATTTATVIAPPAMADAVPLSTEGSNAPAIVASPSGAAVAAGATSPRSTLNLALPPRRAASGPRESMAEQATRDPRANSERRGVEWAVQDAAGTLPVEVQSGTSGSGTTLVRQGSRCTRITENRVAALHPMDDRLRGAPAMAGSCFGK